MSHSLTPPAATAALFSTTKKPTQFPALELQRVWACHQCSDQAPDHRIVYRRTAFLGLAAGAVVGLSNGIIQSANAASRRPPPPPPVEKKDPNLSGVQAKIMASKKRKEAMKEEVARLRERGKGPSE